MLKLEPGALAEQIAQSIRTENQESGFAILIAKIEKISARLDRIEASLLPQNYPAEAAIKHPSIDRFALPDEPANTSSDAKICGFEPHNRPCDHCSMCGSRGF